MKNEKNIIRDLVILSLILAGIFAFLYTTLETMASELTIYPNLKYSNELAIVPTNPTAKILWTGRTYASGAYLIDYNRIVIKKGLSNFKTSEVLSHELGHYVWHKKTTQKQKNWFCRNTIEGSKASWYMSFTQGDCVERFAEYYQLRTYGEWSFLPKTPILNFIDTL